MLYGLVFVTRYLDLFYTENAWNIIGKILFIVTSIYVVVIMLRVYPRTRERERAWKFGIYAVVGSLVLAPLMTWILEKWPRDWFMEVGHSFWYHDDDVADQRI